VPEPGRGVNEENIGQPGCAPPRAGYFLTPIPDARDPARKRSRPEVTVCIANYNCRDLLRTCLRSLSAGRQKARLEIVVVDNASGDGAADMVADVFPRVVLLRNDRNAGFARANNQAARVARGHYLFFLNNDTVVPRGALRELLDFARAHPEAGLVGPRLRDARGRTQLSCRARPTVAALLHRLWLLRWTGLFRRAYARYRRRDGDLRTTQSVEVLMGAAVLVPRDLFFDHGLWDEGYVFGAEDIDLCTRIGRTHQVIYYPEVTVLHHGRMSTRQQIGYVHSNFTVGLVRYLRKYGSSRLALLVFKLALTLDTPVQWLRHTGQYLWRRLCGQRAKAARSLLVGRAVSHFLFKGMVAFWKA
jgi:N-acetylglucosaminyl-diphospho-decaprenol L-rhamnosyltransferase